MKNILLFTDPGIDDSIAIMYALLHPDINLLGIVTSYGNVEKEQATDNVAYLLELANQTTIPIIGGATRSCTGEWPVYYPEIHGPEGLGPIQPPDKIKGELLNFSELFTIVNNYNEIIIVDVGRNTSLATALILDKHFPNNIKEFFIMGGAYLVPGNVTKVAEANFHGDPVASNFIMKELKNVNSIPLNITNKAIVTKEHINAIMERSTNPLITTLLERVFNFYLKAYERLVPGIGGAPLHDVVTLSLVMNPQMGKYLERNVEVQITGENRGQSIADLRAGSENKDQKTKIYLSLDYIEFIKDFITVMSI